MMTDGEYGRFVHERVPECHSTMARPGNEPAKCRWVNAGLCVKDVTTSATDRGTSAPVPPVEITVN